jgi:hypothetical protein
MNRDGPDWIKRAVARGLQRLMSLSLDGQPSANLMPTCAMAWSEALVSGRLLDQALDEPRIDAGFVALTRTALRWPAPAHLLLAMPPRPQRQALPRQMDEVRRARAERFVSQLAAQLGVPRREGGGMHDAALCGNIRGQTHEHGI